MSPADKLLSVIIGLALVAVVVASNSNAATGIQNVVSFLVSTIGTIMSPLSGSTTTSQPMSVYGNSTTQIQSATAASTAATAPTSSTTLPQNAIFQQNYAFDAPIQSVAPSTGAVASGG